VLFFGEGMKSIAAQARLDSTWIARDKSQREEEKSVSRGASLFDSRRTVFHLLLAREFLVHG
jgi:hypothetical protein